MEDLREILALTVEVLVTVPVGEIVIVLVAGAVTPRQTQAEEIWVAIERALKQLGLAIPRSSRAALLFEPPLAVTVATSVTVVTSVSVLVYVVTLRKNQHERRPEDEFKVRTHNSKHSTSQCYKTRQHQKQSNLVESIYLVVVVVAATMVLRYEVNQLAIPSSQA